MLIRAEKHSVMMSNERQYQVILSNPEQCRAMLRKKIPRNSKFSSQDKEKTQNSSLQCDCGRSVGRYFIRWKGTLLLRIERDTQGCLCGIRNEQKPGLALVFPDSLFDTRFLQGVTNKKGFIFLEVGPLFPNSFEVNENILTLMKPEVNTSNAG